MNTNWKPSALALAAVLALTSANAQQGKKDKTDKPEKKSQSITIVRTNDGKDSSEKMTIVLDGEKVTINGKPIEEFKSGDVQVITDDQAFRVISPSRVWTPKVPRTPMAISGTGADVFTWNSDGAVLGVSTEDGDGGAKVTDITTDGAAAKAGLKEGDVITKVNEYNVADSDDLPMAIRKFKPEEKVTITYKRDGKTQTATATLGKNDHKFGHTFAMGDHDFNIDFDKGSRVYGVFGRPRLGLQVEDIQEGDGVKVLDVNEESAAAKAGLKKDDVITSFNGKDIKGVDDIRKAMQEVKQGDAVKVSYKRAGALQTSEIKFPKPVKKATL